jgi:hypothetical protein
MNQVGFLSPSRGWMWTAVGALVMVFGVATPSRAELVNTIFPGDLGIVVTLESPPIPPFEIPLDARVVPTVAARDGRVSSPRSLRGSVFQATGLTSSCPTAPNVGGSR